MMLLLLFATSSPLSSTSSSVVARFVLVCERRSSNLDTSQPVEMPALRCSRQLAAVGANGRRTQKAATSTQTLNGRRARAPKWSSTFAWSSANLNLPVRVPRRRQPSRQGFVASNLQAPRNFHLSRYRSLCFYCCCCCCFYCCRRHSSSSS